MNAKIKKITGSYYTCNSIADYIAEWAIDKPEACVLEPSFGDGIFIDSAVSRFAALGNRNPNIIGVEIQTEPYDLYIRSHNHISGFQMNFMDYHNEDGVTAIIGNPPYVSLKNLDANEREKALQRAYSYGVNMQTSGSLWMPFIIHSTELLEPHGKLGFVLPYEITYVRYAFDLWKYLFNNYGKVTVCRVYRDFFPAVDVETVVLLAEKKGEQTDRVCYKVFETVADLYENCASHISQIPIADIINLEKPFERDLIPNTTNSILQSLRQEGKLAKLINDCKFKIGYVSGNKKFFHPSRETVKNYGIQQKNLRKCLINAKQITSNGHVGVETGSITSHSQLFYPVAINDEERRYIAFGESQGVHKGYKCRARSPWYVIPGLEVPDVVLTVFGDTPKMLLNNGGFYVSNSLLSGFSTIENCKELICRWYNSLTLLSVETSIHSLGGGTLVLIPGETDKLEIMSGFPSDKIETVYEKFSNYAQRHETESVYRYGDNIVLKEIYGLSDVEFHEIRETVSILRSWRNPEKRRG